MYGKYEKYGKYTHLIGSKWVPVAHLLKTNKNMVLDYATTEKNMRIDVCIS